MSSPLTPRTLVECDQCGLTQGEWNTPLTVGALCPKRYLDDDSCDGVIRQVPPASSPTVEQAIDRARLAAPAGTSGFLFGRGELDALIASATAQAEAKVIADRKAMIHAKFGYVKGPEGKCACAYCVGDAEALAEYAGDMEMQNFTFVAQNQSLRDQLASLQAQLDARKDDENEEK